MTHTRAVKDALRSVTDDSGRDALDPRRRRSPDDPTVVVEAAADALADVETAAAFVARGGCARLRRAVVVAGDRGDEAVARRGRDALAVVGRYRRAARGQPSAADSADSDAPFGSTRAAYGSRGTVLNGDSQLADT